MIVPRATPYPPNTSEGFSVWGLMAALPARPCLDCGRVTTNGSRCTVHQSALLRRRSASRGTRQQQGYGADWQRARIVVLNRDGWVCHYCGRPANTVDHIQPKSRGGTDDEANLVAACVSCNSSKRDR